MSNNVAANALLAPTTKAQERRTPKTTEITEDLGALRLKDLPQSSADEMMREAATTEPPEPTPKFETMRIASQISIVDEDELKEGDKSGA
jgi:hypothetical protein